MSTKLTCEQIMRAALGEPARRSGAELLYRCPHPERHQHGDEHPSLSVNAAKDVWLCAPCGGKGKGGWSLAAFIAGVDASDKPAVSAWLRERGLLQKRKAKSGERGPCVATYMYADAGGNPVARKLRFEPGANGRKKDFSWERWENGKWVNGLGENGKQIQIPLYRLSQIGDESYVIVVEGEKDADAGAAIGLPVTTTGAAGSWKDHHSEALRGKAVCVIADPDTTGRTHAQAVAASLYAGDIPVGVIELPGGYDLADFIAGGGTAEQVWAVIEAAPQWQPASGAELLGSLVSYVRRYVSLTEVQARVIALWVFHSHAISAAECTPYLAVSSPDKHCGKTRLFEVLEPLVSKPWLTGRVTAAVLIRKIDAVAPTLLLDESDAAFSGEKEYAEALRGVLNTGYRRSGCASACVGQGANIGFQDFKTFCAKAIAGIGKLPDTVADRSIPIALKRARRGTVARLYQREVAREAGELQAKIAAWCAANLEALKNARPNIPDALSDRQADCAEPLLGIADLAGGEWPEAARLALVRLSGEAQAGDDSTGAKLLRDIQAIFAGTQVDELVSTELVGELARIETSPWGEWSKGKPLSTMKLAGLLKPYQVYPRQIKNGAARGYILSDFRETFFLYLAPTPPPQGVKVSESQYSCGSEANFKVSKESFSDTLQNTVSPNAGAGLRHLDTLKPGEDGHGNTANGGSAEGSNSCAENTKKVEGVLF